MRVAEDLLPKYGRIVAALRTDIEEGRVPIGSTLPSEVILAERFSVSRMTVRQAHAVLERQGLIRRQPGVGTVVVSNRIRRAIASLTGFAEDVRAAGRVPGARLLRFDREAAAGEVAASLGIAPGEDVFSFYRLRTADGEPIGVQDHVVPARFVPALQASDLSDGSLYALIEQRFQLKIGWADQRMHARMPTASEASLLEIPLSTPVWAVERLTRLADGRPFELLDALYRADRVSYSTRLVRADYGGPAADEGAGFLLDMRSSEGDRQD